MANLDITQMKHKQKIDSLWLRTSLPFVINFLCSDLLLCSYMTFVLTAGDYLGAKGGLAKLKYFVNIEEELTQMLAVEWLYIKKNMSVCLTALSTFTTLFIYLYNLVVTTVSFILTLTDSIGWYVACCQFCMKQSSESGQAIWSNMSILVKYAYGMFLVTAWYSPQNVKGL